MTKEQFIKLIVSPSTINLNLITDLEDITTRFPYFQNAHLLLAKQYHGHENIRFESYLRKASAYSGSREKLYRLIKDQTHEVIHIQEKPQTIPQKDEVSKIDKDIPETEIITSEKSDSTFEDSINKTKHSEVSNKTDQQADDPMSILEKRLNEIHAGNINNESQDIIATDNIVESTTDSESESNDITKETLPPLSDENSGINNEIELTELNSEKTETDKAPVPENSIKDDSDETKSSTEPATNEKQIKKRVKDSDEKHSFREWLKIKSLPVIPTENIHEYLQSESIPNDQSSDKSTSSPNSIIEEFIAKEPRIVPAKSDFYSPGNMARKSAQENSDLVSETLARIYAQQGNIRKAIATYQKLILKKPEKSGYFAALIKELEEKEQEE